MLWNSCNEPKDTMPKAKRWLTNHPTLVSDLTNAFEAECNQILTAMFYHVVQSIPKTVETVSAAKREKLSLINIDFRSNTS